MNKKLAMMGVGVVVGSMLIISSAYAGIGDAPGYDAYKSALKNTMEIQNVTRNVNVSVEDNGTALLHVNSTMKTDSTDQKGSMNVALKGGTTEQTIQFYNQDGKQIVKSSGSDVYQVVNFADGNEDFGKHWGNGDKPDAAMRQEAENIVDSLVGNLKNYVTLDEYNGTKDIHFALSGSQISPVVNTIGSAVVKHSSQGQESLPNPSETLGVNIASIKDSLPKLTQDIKVDAVTMNATVDADNHITNQVAQIDISGKDAQGGAHAVVVKVNMGLSDFNNTTPDTVDLNGKKVENVQYSDRHKQGKLTPTAVVN